MWHTQDAHDDGVCDDIWDEPEQQLHNQGKCQIHKYHPAFAKAIGDVGENKAAHSETAPEAGGHIAYFARLAVSDRDEELDDPAWKIRYPWSIF